MDYFDTLIAVADDCPVAAGVAPPAGSDGRTAARLQYELLAGRPHVFTQEDVLFESWLGRHDVPDELSGDDRERLRQDFLSKPQASLRSSPLPMRYGWGLLFDSNGRIALCPMESEEYRRIIAGRDGNVDVLRALRSSPD
jgi:Family of unknown function (DUF6157)